MLGAKRIIRQTFSLFKHLRLPPQHFEFAFQSSRSDCVKRIF